jgi:hypothetical protein
MSELIYKYYWLIQIIFKLSNLFADDLDGHVNYVIDLPSVLLLCKLCNYLFIIQGYGVILNPLKTTRLVNLALWIRRDAMKLTF